MLPEKAARLAKLLDVATTELADFHYFYKISLIVLKSIVFDDPEGAL